jgi:mannose-6-phosphate isomerase-like protein (cupin superfamily)
MEIDEHDGATVAPNNHKIIFENEHVRVLETTIAAGEKTPLHTHLRPTLNHFIRRDENAEIMRDTRADPDAVQPKVHFVESRPKHTIENTDTKDLVVLGIELKNI